MHAHYTDVAALIAEAFRLRAEDLAIRLLNDRMRTSSALLRRALQRVYLSPPEREALVRQTMASDAALIDKAYRCACERGSIRAFENLDFIMLVIDESPDDRRKHFTDAFGWACDCDNLELVEHITHMFEPTPEELQQCVTRAIDANAVRVVERLMPVLVERIPPAIRFSVTTAFLRACSDCALPLAKVRVENQAFFLTMPRFRLFLQVSQILLKIAKILARYCRPYRGDPGLLRVLYDLARSKRLGALETIAWLYDEFELGMPETAEAIKTVFAGYYEGRLIDASPAAQWLFRAAYGLQDPGVAVTRARGNTTISFINTTGRSLMPGDAVRESDLPPGVKATLEATFGGAGILPGGDAAKQTAAAGDSSYKKLSDEWDIPQALLREVVWTDWRYDFIPGRSPAASNMREDDGGNIDVLGTDPDRQNDDQTGNPATYMRTPGFALDEIPPRIEDALQVPRHLNIPGAAAVVEGVPAPRRQPRQPSPPRNNDRRSRRGCDRPANHKKSHR